MLKHTLRMMKLWFDLAWIYCIGIYMLVHGSYWYTFDFICIRLGMYCLFSLYIWLRMFKDRTVMLLLALYDVGWHLFVFLCCLIANDMAFIDFDICLQQPLPKLYPVTLTNFWWSNISNANTSEMERASTKMRGTAFVDFDICLCMALWWKLYSLTFRYLQKFH